MEQQQVASEAGNGAPSIGATETAAAPTTWYSGFDQETVGWLENRGVTKQAPDEALKTLTSGFRNAEKYIGVPHEKLARIPDFEKAEKADLDLFYNKLGRPADPSGYNLEIPKDQPGDFAEWAKGTFHELGISDRQGSALSKKWNEYVGQMTQGQQEQFNSQMADQDRLIRSEWGHAYEKNASIAENAAATLGFDEATVGKLKQALGHDGLLKMMYNIGAKTGEAEYVSGDSAKTFGSLTPAQASSRIQQLRQDKEWASKYLNGNTEAKAEMERLMRMAYP